MRYILIISFNFLFFYTYSQAQEGVYKKYRCTVKKLPVIMDLVLIDSTVSGFYNDGKSDQLIMLEGTLHAGQLILKEVSKSGPAGILFL
ncbi:MAG: hypothetical protein H0W62_03275 [Chitinophagales bacterium]|nr:hypothetical protein [Chitinophagales bacterium]